MSEKRFTQGPWQAMDAVPARHALGEDDELVEIWGVDPEGASHGYDGVRVAYLFLTHNGDDERLILAAPELCAAADAAMPLLLCVLAGAKQHGDTETADRVGAVVQMIANAVAKARGQA